MSDDRIDYIKTSVDSLHIKIETLYADADKRLKVLEIEGAHQKGMFKGGAGVLAVVAGVIGSALTMAADYFTKK